MDTHNTNLKKPDQQELLRLPALLMQQQQQRTSVEEKIGKFYLNIKWRK
jgi:hypothetical protein